MVLKLSLHHQVGSSNAGAPETSAKSGTLFLLSVSGYKRSV